VAKVDQLMRDPTAPATSAAAVDLGADADYTDPKLPLAIYVGTGGDVKVNMAGTGTAIVFADVPSGSILPVCVTKIYSTANGTAAADLVALFNTPLS
jgi:hypothetical protein